MPPAAPGVALLNVESLGKSDLGDLTKAGPHPQQPSKIWGSKTLDKPLPTNRWWVNLVLPDVDAVGENVVSPLPYLAKALTDGLHVCLPSKDAAAGYVALPFEDTLAFGAHELGHGATHTLETFDDLSATLEWTAGSKQTMRTPLVRGMPYVSAIYEQLTPQLTLATSAVAKLNGKALSGGGSSLKASRLQLELTNGQTWVVYAQETVEMRVDSTGVRFVSPYNGVLRAAAVATAESLDVLDAYASRVPLGGEVQAVAHGDHVTLTFAFRATGAGPLLTMALPHHTDTGHLAGVARTALRYETLKGTMLGVVGDTWTVHEQLPRIDWGAPRPIDPSRVDAVRAALEADKEKPMLVPDPYGAGKEMGAIGRLALIADELGEEATAASLRTRLAARLEEWLSGKGQDPLQYEPTYGGLVSANGLADRAADFGGGWYNDHHFHYGYFLYAAAAVGRKDRAWLRKWAPAIAHLIRDIANPSQADPLYPPHRFKDWYVGHSWASGIFPSASGRNQESVSEALNAWYGLALYGLALGDVSLRDLGRTMLATELRSGWRYWQIDEKDSIYPPVFAQNGLAAVVWSTKVDKTTWFGSNVEYAYGIQAMPVTPITELWLRPSWLAATQPIWGAAMDSATEQWRGILLMMAAVNQPADAWKNAFLLTLFDNGNTKTNVLYWIATRGDPKCELPHCDSSAGDNEAPAIAAPPSPPLEQAAEATDDSEEEADAGPPVLPLAIVGAFAIAAVVFLASPAIKRVVEHYKSEAEGVTAPVGAAAGSDAEYHRL